MKLCHALFGKCCFFCETRSKMALRAALLGLDSPAILDDSGLEPFLDEPKNALVSNTVLQEFHHPVVIDAVKVGANVSVQYPANLPGSDSHPYCVERIMLAPPRSESI